jgi:hypothetical protein
MSPQFVKADKTLQISSSVSKHVVVRYLYTSSTGGPYDGKRAGGECLIEDLNLVAASD